jgi:hypothetical protein
MYKIGTIKVAWINKDNFNELNSLMFENLKDALSYTQDKSDYMIMELIEQNDNYYKWKVLPYGNYRSYHYGMVISKNILLLTLLGGLIGFGAYKLVKDGI